MRYAWLIIGALMALVWGCAVVGASTAQAPLITAVHTWAPPSPAEDRLDAAEAALRNAPAGKAPFEFRNDPKKATWYALDLAPAGEAAVLELTHPSVRSALLYLPGASEPVGRGGRDVLPPAARADIRFPATLEIPPGAQPHRVYLRVWSTVPVRGRFLLEPAGQARSLSQTALLAMSLCFAIATLVAAYSFMRAARLRSAAWGLYGVMGLCTLGTPMFLLGFAESWLWPALSAWRGEAAAVCACLTSGLCLLISERVFALYVRAPRFTWVLRIAGAACVVGSLAGLAIPQSVFQIVAQSCGGMAAVLGLISLWLAWRTHNRPAAWMLAGFVPMLLGVGATAIALAGVYAFQPWVLMAMPVGAVLKLPFHLYGLTLLERRQQQVRQSLAEALQGAAEGESRRALALRLARASGRVGTGSLLMLARIDCLAPGSPTLGKLDAVGVERFVHMLMKAAVRPGIEIGRWSHHELALRGSTLLGSAALDALFTQMFVRAHRLTRMGVEPGEARLRIAFGRVPPGMAFEGAVDALEKLLDDQRHAVRARLEWDFNQRCLTNVATA